MTIEQEQAGGPESAVTAIDIALEPDETMVGHAQAANATLLQNFPKGFLLDATHHPHVSIFAGFVPTADLPKVYAAAGKVLAKENYTSWKLTAFKYYYIPLGPIGLGGIVVKPTLDLLRLQQELIDAVGPFTVKTATAAAFYTTPAEPDIHQSVIDYIAAFMAEHSGKNFSPHVTIGVGTTAFLDAMLAESFSEFTFSPASASVYQFGDFGAARNRLKSFPAKMGAPIDPLASWNDGVAKKSIVDFVARVTEPGSADYVAPAERIATFDNDGTLWSEQPYYFQIAFALDRVKAMASLHPEWQEKEPFKSVLAGDLKGVFAGGLPGLAEIATATHSGMTVEEFEVLAREWQATTRHPKTNKLFTEMVFQPMVELLAYLRANGFKTFIVSGGGVEFMRTFAEVAYGVPPEQVIGSSGKLKYERRDGQPVLTKLPVLELFDDNVEKPAAIQKHIGRRPIASFGNSDGDLEMLQWTTAGAGARFAMLINHTDPVREWAYDRSAMGRLDKALDEANAKGWTVVDMKNDWRRIFPFETVRV